MWKMSVEWSLAENDATFRGGSSADNVPLPAVAEKATAGTAALAAGQPGRDRS